LLTGMHRLRALSAFGFPGCASSWRQSIVL